MRKTLLQFTACTLCLVGFVGLSGCLMTEELPCGNVILGVDDNFINLTENNIDIDIEGVEIIQPCLTGANYTAKATGWNFVGTLSGVEWIVSGDIEITGDPHYNPLSIIGTKDNGYGTITLVTTGTEGCPGGKILATKGILASFAETADIVGEVCLDPVTQTGSGKLQLVYKPFLPTLISFLDDCTWSVSSGSADLYPQPDKVTCLVENATGDFTVHCEVTKNKCSSEKPLSFDIKVPVCQAAP